MEMLKKYIFTTDGRLNRLRYLKYALAFGFFMGLVTFVLVFVAALITSENSTLVRAVQVLTTLVGAIGGWALVIRRLHDLNKPAWWLIGMLIPIVNIIFGFYLLLAPGTRGYNQYGEDPLD